MALLKPIENGNMYPGWWRWNPISGCLHGCSYCYIKAMQKRFGKDMMTPVFREDYLNDDLGSGRKIAVCLSGDMWGKWVSSDHIGAVLEHCREYPENEYMFLTKNPRRYYPFVESGGEFPAESIFGATVETDLEAVLEPYKAYLTPSVGNRLDSLSILRERFWADIKIMVSIEPVMKFSGDFSARIYDSGPDIVYIGADSGMNGLPEPSGDELRGLMTELEAFAKVHRKKNLARLMPELAKG